MFHLNWISKYRDELFGLAMLQLFLFHYTEDYWQAVKTGIIESSSIGIKGYFFLGYHEYVGSIGVEIFLFLSGMGLYYSFHKKPDLKRFYSRRMRRIIVPYSIVAIIFWSLKDILIYNEGIVDVIKDFSFYTFFSEGVKTIWFIGLMIVLYLVFPVIYELVGKKNQKKSLINLIITIILIEAGILLLKLISPGISGNINIAVTRIPIFIVGVFSGRYIMKDMTIRTVPAIIIAVFCIIIGILSHMYFKHDITIRFASSIYSIGFLIILAWLLHIIRKWNLINRFLRFVGLYSLELYMCHVTLRNLMKDLGMDLYRVHVFGIMLIGAFIFAYILKRIDKAIPQNLYTGKHFADNSTKI